MMYNLTVDTAHTFFVGDGQWLVHNTCPLYPLNNPQYSYPIIEASTPPLAGNRRTAINRAFALEKELIETTGMGTYPWSESQLTELRTKGLVSGFTGHHINNVASFPEWQGDPRNITFVRTGSIHMNDYHGGAWTNPTSGNLIDRQAMINDYLGQ